jgi:hypothetical protein
MWGTFASPVHVPFRSETKPEHPVATPPYRGRMGGLAELARNRIASTSAGLVLHLWAVGDYAPAVVVEAYDAYWAGVEAVLDALATLDASPNASATAHRFALLEWVAATDAAATESFAKIERPSIVASDDEHTRFLLECMGTLGTQVATEAIAGVLVETPSDPGSISAKRRST